jgi:hypothetical protein
MFMSKLSEFRAAEIELGKQLAALEALRNDSALKMEIAFESALTKLLDDFGLSRDTLLDILGASPAQAAKSYEVPGKTRKTLKREIPKTFLNPHTGEKITVKRLTNGKYRGWVEKHGEVIVQSWLQE